MGILNTMDNEIISSKSLLRGTGISLLDAARLIRNILDALPDNSNTSPIQFCVKVIEVGKRNIRSKEMQFAKGFSLYLQAKGDLRPDSLQDIRYLGSRLIKANPGLAECNFSEFTIADCEAWLSETFTTPSQFNKGRTMLHGLFEFAFRREWCDRNPVKLIERKKVIEREIKPLKLSETQKLINTAKSKKYKNCLPATAILIHAGIRPREVSRLKWSDIDLNENSITIRSQCSKTGGVRQVEICPTLKNILQTFTPAPNAPICPQNWKCRWKSIRDESGFKNSWIQDVLRHTYASYYAKYYKDLPRLQLNMGHRNQSLLYARYVNMSGISKSDAKRFFGQI